MKRTAKSRTALPADEALQSVNKQTRRAGDPRQEQCCRRIGAAFQGVPEDGAAEEQIEDLDMTVEQKQQLGVARDAARGIVVDRSDNR